MRYAIQQNSLEPDQRLELFRALLIWAAQRSDRFVLSMYLPHYEGRTRIDALRGLGEVIDDPTFYAIMKIDAHPSNDENVVHIAGIPGEEFVREMTTHAAPAGAISGDESPVEDLWLFSGDRQLYSVYDYGRDHGVDIDSDEEEQDLHAALLSLNIGPDVLYAWPTA